MKINLGFDFDKLHLKEITILIPKYHPNMVSFLTPILGLYGINVKEFINDFEEKTKFINFDVIVPVRVKISKIKTFSISVKTPYIVPILQNIEGFSLNKPLNILTVYKISLIKSIFLKYRAIGIHKRIYLSIKLYVSKLLKTGANVHKKLTELNVNTFISLKKNILNFIFFRKITNNRYGSFFCFNNLNNLHIGYLDYSLSLLNLKIFKVPSNFLNVLTSKSFFSGNVIYIGSNSFNFFHSFSGQISSFVQKSNLFVTYLRFNSNLISPAFFKIFINSFNMLLSKNITFLLFNIFLKTFKSLAFLNIAFLRLLKFNADLSSNIKKS